MKVVTDLKILRQKSGEVSVKEAKKIIKDLEETMKNCPTGIGLSAIQIGILKKVGIIRIKELRLNLINTKILEKEDKFRMRTEACLSLPGLKIDTIRYNTVKINNNGKEEVYHGLLAVAIEHELDHWQGKLIIDKVWRKRK